MMKFSRRIFLQGIATTVACWWGWNNRLILSPSQLIVHGATLKQSNVRKLALLIGINQYSQGKKLRGCLTDVELQRQLLINHFDFSSQDIITLINQEANKEKIIDTFKSHLQAQAQKDDLVIFHFSGYGRTIQSRGNDNSPVQSLIAYDTISPKNNIVNDILLDTLTYLAENLNTNKYVIILDTSFNPSSNPLKQKLSLRGYQANPELTISQAEYDFKQELQKNLLGVKVTNPSGLILSPKEEAAVEIHSPNLNVGLLSYILTQSLWANSNAVDSNDYLLQQINSDIALYSNQVASIVDVNNFSYFAVPQQSQGVAIVKEIMKPNTVELELVGLPIFLLFNYSTDSRLQTADNNGESVTVQINSLVGNKAKATVVSGNIDALKQGTVFRESSRVIPHNIGLKIGLNGDLEKIEKVDATSALTAIDIVESVSNVGDNFVDCILDKSHDDDFQGYSLFSPTGVLFTNTSPSSAQEGVFTAVKRLHEALNINLACKLLNLTYNDFASDLGINASLEVSYNNSASKITKYTGNSSLNNIQKIDKSKTDHNSVLNIPRNSQITININNEDRVTLHYLLLVINSARELMIYNQPETTTIASGKNATIPDRNHSFKWFLNNSEGMGEFLLFCSRSPFEKTFTELGKINALNLENEKIIPIQEPIKIAKSILEDLHLGSNLKNNTDSYTLDINHWVTFNFVYQMT